MIKIINNIIAVLIILLNYKIAKYITNEENSSLLVALISGFIPIFVIETFNSLNSFNLFLFLFVFQIYNFISFKNKYNIHFYLFILITIILPFVSPLSILLAFSLLLFLALAFIEGLDVVKHKVDLIIFTSIYLIWAQFLIYKNLFLNFGPDVIYQNIPNSLIENYFIDTSLRSMIFEIGFIPLVFGIFIIYFFIFKKQRFLLSLFPFFLVFLFLIFFRLISLKIGLILIGELFVLIFMFFFKLALDWIKNSKFDRVWYVFLLCFFFIFLFSSYIPIQSQLIEISHDKEIENNEYLYEFIKENLKGKKILADYKYGFFIQSVGAISMLDQDFYKLKNSQKILTDIKIFYSFTSSVSSLRILEKYDVDYFLINKNILKSYGQESFKIENDLCFKDTKSFVKIYDDGFNQIYKGNCLL